ncbi:MAG: hypothetical protein HY760_06290 [Nitrospirae bacterium]|nr:hypothetical protein [Nitrospirota bacterium]
MRRRLIILAGGLQMVTGLVILGSLSLLERVEYVHIHHPYAYLIFQGLGGWVFLLGGASLYLFLSGDKRR